MSFWSYVGRLSWFPDGPVHPMVGADPVGLWRCRNNDGLQMAGAIVSHRLLSVGFFYILRIGGIEAP